MSFGTFLWQGLIRFEHWQGADTPNRLYVISDRNDPLGEDYAMRPGMVDEVQDETLAKTAIAKAIVECFDHSITREALPDGKGGWITLDTNN